MKGKHESKTFRLKQFEFLQGLAVWTPPITSLLQFGFCLFGALHLARKAWLWLVPQVNQGLEQMISLVIKKFKRESSHLFQPGTLRVTVCWQSHHVPHSQHHQIRKGKSGFGRPILLIKLTKGWCINLPHHALVGIKWECGYKTYLSLPDTYSKWKKVLVAQVCSTLCDSMACILPGSSVCGISQARILQWVAIPFSRESSEPRDGSRVSFISRWNL